MVRVLAMRRASPRRARGPYAGTDSRRLASGRGSVIDGMTLDVSAVVLVGPGHRRLRGRDADPARGRGQRRPARRGALLPADVEDDRARAPGLDVVCRDGATIAGETRRAADGGC